MDYGIIIYGIIESEITDSLVLWPAGRLLAMSPQKLGVSGEQGAPGTGRAGHRE
jgi:hypothetical protein